VKLDTLVDRDDAKARLEGYRTLVAEERTAEDDAIAAGYRAAARGLPVVSLPEVMSAGGWFDDGLPRLAIARADTTRVWVKMFERAGERTVLHFTDETADWSGTIRAAHVGRHGVRTWAERASVVVRDREWHWRSHSTIVPIVPPQFRPTRRRLRLFHVLWEVERWDSTPPVDPALLRHIRGDLWAVQATWDLTPLERAVLSARTA
jgi:hypothetical protein